MLHDLSDFPLVRLSGRGLPEGYGPQWVAEMDALVDRGEPFALVFLDAAENEPHEDRKLRTLWLKRNKARFAAICRGIVASEPDAARRLVMRAQAAGLALAFGMTLAIVPDRQAAERRALELLAGAAPTTDDR